MQPGARMRAAVEVLDDIFQRHRPATLALADWGRSHRFAGSGDRAAIGNLVFDVLRRRSSLAAQMGSDETRALVLAAAQRAFAMTPEAVVAAASGPPHAIDPVSESERDGLVRAPAADLPLHVLADVPDWLTGSIERAFGANALAECRALAERAPVDLRVNTLKADRDRVLKALARFNPSPTRLSPVGIRIAAPEGPGRTPNVEADAAHAKGWFEVQDEGSQIAALLAGAGPRMQVLDFCAGAGGKTLAMAAGMHNTGQIYAYDEDAQRLRPIFERVKRAGVRNAQMLTAGDRQALLASGPRFDVVLVDAPCTGSGVWRRRPDAKWRLKPAQLAERIAEQRKVLETAAALVKPGGRLAYVTCSILPEENSDQVAWFLSSHPTFVQVTMDEAWAATFAGPMPLSADAAASGLLLTPASHETDGFFIAHLMNAS